MPIYEYECSRCGNIEEIQVSWLDIAQSQSCSICSAEMTKIISVPSKGIVK